MMLFRTSLSALVFTLMWLVAITITTHPVVLGQDDPVPAPTPTVTIPDDEDVDLRTTMPTYVGGPIGSPSGSWATVPAPNEPVTGTTKPTLAVTPTPTFKEGDTTDIAPSDIAQPIFEAPIAPAPISGTPTTHHTLTQNHSTRFLVVKTVALATIVLVGLFAAL